VGTPSAADGDAAWVPLVDLLASSDDQLLDRHGRWYIPRREPRWLRRNALVALGNVARGDDPAVLTTLERYASGDDDLLAEHARWALAELAEVVEA
jgi:epoxyqueuosine reductase